MNVRKTSEDVAERLNREVTEHSARLARQVAALIDRAAGLAERLDSVQADVSQRVKPKPKRRRARGVLLLAAAAGLGYLAAYLFDPQHGRGRRSEIGRRLNGVGREATRTAQRTIIIAGDRAAGIRSSVIPGRSDNPDPDDLTLLDRVESEVFGDPSIPKGDINVMVVDGRAVLRGEVEEEQIGAIEAAVRKVVGVKDVENLLHVPGVPAANKAEARAVGNGTATGS